MLHVLMLHPAWPPCRANTYYQDLAAGDWASWDPPGLSAGTSSWQGSNTTLVPDYFT